jgi:hypothetical protein
MFHSIDVVHCQDFSLCLEHFGVWLSGDIMVVVVAAVMLIMMTMMM